MPKVSFVIGATASGKTYYIDHNFAGRDVVILNIYDYQQKAYEESGFKHMDMMPMPVQFRCLMKANDDLLNDIIERLKQGNDVVAEQTLFKAKRRIAYVDAIRETVDADIEIFVMCPGEERWRENIRLRKLEDDQGSIVRTAADIEFPNPAEGFDSIYEVSDDGVKLRMDQQLEKQFLEDARRQVAEEKERIEKEDEKTRRQQELLESMKTRPFWHYCEVCGKKEFITDEEAFNSGWDYPPKIGFFGMLGPRTCGSCQMMDTLYWKIQTSGKLPIVMEGDLNDKELVTWRRIKGEPESLLEEEN